MIRSRTRGIVIATLLAVAPGTAVRAAQTIDVAGAIERFAETHHGTALHFRGSHVAHVFGPAFGRGDGPRDTAAGFLDEHAGILGLDAGQLAPAPDRPGHVVPLGYDPATGTYRFTSLHYVQVVEGVPVWRTRLVLLVRNEPGFPLVLVSADLRDVGGFQMPALVAGADTVVWAGSSAWPAAPRAARVEADDDWISIVDALTGDLLHRESAIVHEEVEGSVSGMATAELGADFCGPEAPIALPYARVAIGETTAFADASGLFTIDAAGPGPVVVESRLWGPYFRVFNEAGIDAAITAVVTPPATVEFMHNAANEFEFVRAQTNAYLHANIVRDFVLEMSPAYPTIAEQLDFPVNVNLDASCNAFYSTTSQTINFFTSGQGCPNTAYDTIVYHEYGHHLVAMAGSGQGAYGEGMADTVAVVLTDQPVVGWGWRGDCEDWLRNADNDCQYSPDTCTENCGSQVHACGRLLSGSVWSLRNELAATDPDGYRETLGRLTLDSILLHTGSAVDPLIPIDFLTLDDDNDDIFDGTPHFAEIAAAFGAHGLAPPLVAVLGFEFPDGLPATVSPFGDASVRVEVTAALGDPAPGTGLLHVSVTGPDGPYVALPMVSVAPNVYDAVFPELDCGDTVHYYVSAESVAGKVETFPASAPGDSLTAIAATAVTLVFVDDFELDLGWTVESDGGLIDGAWDRGVPVDCVRGDPPADADGSGQCYLTDNSAAAGCNSDVDGGATTLVSPLLTGADSSAYVAYQRWYSNDQGDEPFLDVMTVEISSDGGRAWTLLETVGPDGPDAMGGWHQRRFRVADAVPPTGEAMVRFVVADAGGASIVEAAVDDVRIERYTCDPCPADTDGDGEVGVLDLIQVITAWGTDDESADVDSDGIVAVLDLVAVILAWGPC